MHYLKGPVEIRASKAEDATAFTGKLRAEDEREIHIFGHKDVESCLRFGYLQSVESYTILYKGVPAAMFGLVPRSLLGSDACVWFLGTAEMCHIKKTFMKLSRFCIGEWLNKYPVLWNIVPADYEKSLKWLRWLGADMREVFIKGEKFNIISFAKV